MGARLLIVKSVVCRVADRCGIAASLAAVDPGCVKRVMERVCCPKDQSGSGMTRFIQGEDRTQSTLFPERLDDFIAEDSAVRVVDLFIDELDLCGLGFRTKPKAMGRPAYDPTTMLKLYVYGYLNRAYSGPCRSLIPAHADHRFRPCRSPIPAMPISWDHLNCGGRRWII